MAGTFRGRGEIFAFLGRLPKETDGTYSSTLIDVLASDDRAAALYRARGERRGTQLELDQVLLFRIADGLIRKVSSPCRATPRRSIPSGPDERPPIRRWASLPVRDPVGRRTRRDASRAGGGRGARGSRATGVAGIGRDDADGRRARRDGAAREAATGSRCRCSSARAEPGIPVASRSSPQPSASQRGAPPGSSSAWPRYAGGLPTAFGRTSWATSVCWRRSDACDRRGDLPPDLVLKTSVLLPCANGATARLLEECGATTINVSTDLSVAGSERDPAGVHCSARRLRRGPGRPGWVRTLLRGAGHDQGGGTDVREARPAQRAQHLPVGPPPRRDGDQARPRARPPRGARPPADRRASPGARRGSWGRSSLRSRRPTTASRDDVLRLRPVRRPHVRLLRDPDRLGTRHRQRASARARSSRRRCHGGRAPRAVRAGGGGARGRPLPSLSQRARGVAAQALPRARRGTGTTTSRGRSPTRSPPGRRSAIPRPRSGASTGDSGSG